MLTLCVYTFNVLKQVMCLGHSMHEREVDLNLQLCRLTNQPYTAHTAELVMVLLVFTANSSILRHV
jgi:hypothetical protein